MTRRAAAILLAIAFIVALPSTASSATSSGKPAAEAAAAKKKPKKAKKRKKKPKIATKLWYRIALDSTATVTGASRQPGGIVTNSTWKGQSRAAVILFREPAPVSPTAGRGPILSRYRFKTGIAGTVVAASRQISSQSPNECPAPAQSLVQITPGSVDAMVDGRLLEGGGGTVGLIARTLPGDAIEAVTAGMCLQDPPPRHTPAPGAVMCPPESGWQPTGKVAWRRAFTITATCFDSQVDAITGGSTTVVASLTLAFTPCPGGGVKVARC